MPSYPFSKSMRLLRASEFERVFAARTCAGDNSLLIYGATNDVGHPRLGLTVSRKVGRSVVRNQWKRVIRESFRLVQHDLPALDLVCIPRGDSIPDSRRLLRALPALAGRIEQQFRNISGPGSRKRP